MKRQIKKIVIRIGAYVYARPGLDRRLKKILSKYPRLKTKLKRIVNEPLSHIEQFDEMEMMCHFRFPLVAEYESLSKEGKRRFDEFE